MTLLIDALPLLALVILLGSGRVTPATACLAALALTVPAAAIAGLDLPSFLARSAAEGAWLAIAPVGIVIGGLLFQEVASRRAQSETTAGDPRDILFEGAFLLGGFTETVTGFGVGAVFALAAFRRAGVGGVPAAAMALFSQLLIPWGGLGPGTAIGAALAGVPAQTLAARNAIILAIELPLLLPLFWHLCALAGHRVDARRRLAQTGWLLAEGALLIGLHRLVPWEVCGLLATGLVFSARRLRADPPRDAATLRAMLAGAGPYLLLAGVLLASRMLHDVPAIAPFAHLPALPLNHAVVGLWVVALALLAVSRVPLAVLPGSLARGRRAAIALLMFVLLARFLANAGVPRTLALALADAMGAAAPFAGPLLAGAAGFFAGSNVGSNGAMMPLQAELGRAAGLGPLVLPAVQNGTIFLLLSPQVCTLAASLAGPSAAGARATPPAIWRLAWPIFPIGLAVGMAWIALA